MVVERHWITGYLLLALGLSYCCEPRTRVFRERAGMPLGAGEQESDFLAQVPSFPSSPTFLLRNQAGTDVCIRWLSAEELRRRGSLPPTFRASTAQGATAHSCPPAEWGSNRLVLQTAQWELDCGRRRGTWGEEGREREGAGREEELVKTPDSTPNPFAKSLSTLILISERFTWVEHCF